MNAIRQDEPFLGILSFEKTDAIKRGESVTITPDESSRFMTLMDEFKDKRIAELESFTFYCLEHSNEPEIITNAKHLLGKL